MPNSSITINLETGTDYSRVIGKKVNYSNASAELRAVKGGIEILFSAEDTKSLFASMSSIIKQITVVGSVLNMVEKQEAQQLNSRKTQTSKVIK